MIELKSQGASSTMDGDDDTAYSDALTQAFAAMPTMANRGPGRASRGEINDQSRLGAAGGVPALGSRDPAEPGRVDDHATLGSRDPAEPGRVDDHAGLTEAHAWRCAAGQLLAQPSAFLESEHRLTSFRAVRRAFGVGRTDGAGGTDECSLCLLRAQMGAAPAEFLAASREMRHDPSCHLARQRRPHEVIALGTWGGAGGRTSGPAAENCRVCDEPPHGGLAMNFRHGVCPACRRAAQRLLLSPFECALQQLRSNAAIMAHKKRTMRQEQRGLYDRIPRVDPDYGYAQWEPKQGCADTERAAVILDKLRCAHFYPRPANHTDLLRLLGQDDAEQGQKGLYSLSPDSGLARGRNTGARAARTERRAEQRTGAAPEQARVFFRNLDGTPAYGRDNGINSQRDLTSIFWSVALAVKENRDEFSIFTFGECLPDIPGLCFLYDPWR